MRVLGIDPGSRITGYGLVDQAGNKLVHVDNGAIFTDKAVDFAGRLKTVSYTHLTLQTILRV